jgi:chromosome segregation ATPase
MHSQRRALVSEDLTNKLRPNIEDQVALILTAVNDLIFRVGMSERKFDDFAEKLEQRLQNVGSDIAQLKEGQGRLEERMGGLEERMGGLEERMGGLEGRMGGLEERMGGLEEGQESLRSDLTALRRRMDHQFMKLSGEVEKRYREHDQRITRLETNTNPANSQT